MRVVTLCTGNATRSVIAQLWLMRERPEIEVVSRGTLSIEGLPISFRTRNALELLELDGRLHRSSQLFGSDLVNTDLVLASEIEHVAWVRRDHPEAAPVTITLRRLARDLSSAHGPFTDRLAALEPATIDLEAWEDVIDPAGGEQMAFDRCAKELDALLADVVDRL